MTIRIVILGDNGCGKNSLVRRYDTQNFTPVTTTYKNRIYYKDMTLKQSQAVLKLAMLSLPTTDELLHRATKDANGIAIIFDVTSLTSWGIACETAQKIIHLYDSQIVQLSKRILVGNKSETNVDDRPVPSETYHAHAQKLGFNYIETSAMTGENVTHLFEEFLGTLQTFYDSVPAEGSADPTAIPVLTLDPVPRVQRQTSIRRKLSKIFTRLRWQGGQRRRSVSSPLLNQLALDESCEEDDEESSARTKSVDDATDIDVTMDFGGESGNISDEEGFSTSDDQLSPAPARRRPATAPAFIVGGSPTALPTPPADAKKSKRFTFPAQLSKRIRRTVSSGAVSAPDTSGQAITPHRHWYQKMGDAAEYFSILCGTQPTVPLSPASHSKTQTIAESLATFNQTCATLEASATHFSSLCHRGAELVDRVEAQVRFVRQLAQVASCVSIAILTIALAVFETTLGSSESVVAATLRVVVDALLLTLILSIAYLNIFEPLLHDRRVCGRN